MISYRLCSEKYAHDLNGTGARLNGGRWNSRGLPLIYSSEHESLCVLEILVHLDKDELPEDLVLVKYHLPDGDYDKLDYDSLGQENGISANGLDTQNTGDTFLKDCKKLCLLVPSVVFPYEYNVLINPGHPEASNIRILEIIAFNWDPRL